MIRFIKVRNVQNGYAKVFYKKRNANVAGHCSAFKIDVLVNAFIYYTCTFYLSSVHVQSLIKSHFWLSNALVH